MAQMKDCIVVFSENTRNWGAERSVCSMCDYLQKQGQKVLVIIPRPGEIINLLNAINVEYLILPYNKWTCKIGGLKVFTILKNIISEYRNSQHIIKEVSRFGYTPKLVYSSVILTGTGAFCSSKWNVPHVHHFRENIDAFGYQFIYGYQRTMSYIMRHSNLIICTCNAIRERYINDLPSTRIVVVNNGVPPVASVPNRNYQGTLRLVQVARYMDDKRVIDTLQALNHLVKKGIDDIHLDLYGRGPELGMYESYISQNKLEPYITNNGFVESIDFSKYHVGIMSSTFEAFARTTLDYMNNGLAVVASNTGGNLEQVVDNETGLLYKVKDHLSMASALEKLYSNRELVWKFGCAGRTRFLDLFTQEKYQNNIGGKILSLISTK